MLPFMLPCYRECNVYKPSVINGLSQICYMLHSFSYLHNIFNFITFFILSLSIKCNKVTEGV